ncbi:ABC transporter ATP-binding protein [Paremcibacter congregatus]|uniref:ABC transporter n=1 Tax=Paremcibacter congregatus TaxID=2043170 RepID=A0A2G4YTJ4_9PROT|nr:ABC transporter ATP-binding protein [Paremcibacter congregatus]PHZ85658.1 ABC transporter [Paremcibacter congregatus]QDE26618.1 ABC transporter ATP-binding protein [Paremcibacter congregatus]
MTTDTTTSNSLQARDIHVTLNDRKILNGASLNVPKGKLVGLIGPNGAGKSTLLKAILGLTDHQAGEITLNGATLDGWSLKERAKRVSYAAQGAPVHWPLDVEHIIALGRIPHLDPWQKITAADREIIHQAMVTTDTLHLKDRLTTTLSGGERACVMLARTIVSQAEYLCADEPIASLDPYHQLQVMDILHDLSRAGHGVLIVLHDLTLAQRYCDDLVLMHDGEIMAHGTAENVLTEENLDRAYHIQASRWHENGDHFLVPWKRSGTPRHKGRHE